MADTEPKVADDATAESANPEESKPVEETTPGEDGKSGEAANEGTPAAETDTNAAENKDASGDEAAGSADKPESPDDGANSESPTADAVQTDTVSDAAAVEDADGTKTAGVVEDGDTAGTQNGGEDADVNNESKGENGDATPVSQTATAEAAGTSDPAAATAAGGTEETPSKGEEVEDNDVDEYGDEDYEEDAAEEDTPESFPKEVDRSTLLKMRQRHYIPPKLIVTPIDLMLIPETIPAKPGMCHQSCQTTISSAPPLRYDPVTESVIEDPETAEIVQVMKRYQRLLRRVFDHYARRVAGTDDELKVLNFEEFFILAKEFALFPGLTEQEDLRDVFAASNRSGKHLEFRDFIECLTRLSLSVYRTSDRFETSEQKLAALFRAMHLDCKDIVLHR